MSTYRQYTINKSVYFISIYPKLDKDNKANVSELTEISDYKDDSYSLETVIQLYEGEGYSEVN